MASIWAALFAISIPALQRMVRHFLCSTTWAKQQGFTPEQLHLFSFRGGNLWKGIAVLAVGLLLIFAQHKAITSYLGLRGSQSPTQRNATADSSGALGPVIERVLPDPAAGIACVLDFETGMLLEPPAEVAQVLTNDVSTFSPAALRWLRDNSADAVLAPDGSVQLIEGVVLSPTVQGRAITWEELTPSLVASGVAGMNEEGRKASIHQPAFHFATMRYPAAMEFTTRERSMGVLQILGSSSNPPGVKIRYKLVQAGMTDTLVFTTNAPVAESNDPFGDFMVKGRVTDEQGTGLSGVTITAHCGEGTLRPTGETRSGPDGRYTLHFRAGMRGLDESTGQWRIGVQAATIHPSKTGHFDANLNRQGDLLMADRMPAPDENAGWKMDTNRIVLPHQPFELNFVMLPAATVEGALQDENGQSVGRQSVCLSGDKLPPSSSVLHCVETDTAGRFRFDNVPTIGRWWFSLSRPNERREFRSDEFSFVHELREHFELRLNPSDGARGIVVTARKRLPK